MRAYSSSGSSAAAAAAVLPPSRRTDASTWNSAAATHKARDDDDDGDDEVATTTGTTTTTPVPASRKRARDTAAATTAVVAAHHRAVTTTHGAQSSNDSNGSSNFSKSNSHDDDDDDNVVSRCADESVLPVPQLAQLVASQLHAHAGAVRYVLEQAQQGATVPFLARYRQEETRHMDETTLRRVLDTAREAAEVHRRRAFMLRSLQQRGLLTPALRARLTRMLHLSQLEDEWEAYKERKTSLAARARACGLAPLAEVLLHGSTRSHAALQSPAALQRYVATAMRAHDAPSPPQQQRPRHDDDDDAKGKYGKASVSSDDAERLLVALVDEHVQRTLTLRETLLRCAVRHGHLASSIVRSARKAAAKALDDAAFARRQKHFAFYDGKRWPVRHLRSHIVLALLRGEREGVLHVDMPPAAASHGVFTRLVCAHWRGLAARTRRYSTAQQQQQQQHDDNDNNENNNYDNDAQNNKQHDNDGHGTLFSRYERQLAQRCLATAYEHVMRTVHATVKRDLRKAAERVAMDVFADNLRHMLLQRPLAQARLLAMDPGLRNGVKCVCLDEQGGLLGYFTCNLSDEPAMRQRVREAMRQHALNKIVIGNGTASQQTLTLVAQLVQEAEWQHVEFAVVSEAGASVYSVSDAAAREFPTLSAMYRGAVSIGRRVLDPLSELVKVPVRSMGIGMYQHDVNERALEQALLRVVESCVTTVGVVVLASSANRYVMQHVPGLSPALLEQVLLAQHAHTLNSRADLRRVPGMTEATYLQIAGFFRFPCSPEPLDNTRIHPESYALVHTLLRLQAEDDDASRGRGDSDNNNNNNKNNNKNNSKTFAAQCARLGHRLANMTPAQQSALLATALSRMQPTQQQQHGNESATTTTTAITTTTTATTTTPTLPRFGVETLRLIAHELQYPGLDPRASLPHAGLLRRELRSAEELRRGDVLRGIVQSVTTFGVFVDCGLHNAVLVRFPCNNNNSNNNSSSTGGGGDVADVMRLWHVGSYVDSLVVDGLDELGRPQVRYVGGGGGGGSGDRHSDAADCAGGSDVRDVMTSDAAAAQHDDAAHHHRLAAAVAAAAGGGGGGGAKADDRRSSRRDGTLLLEFDDMLHESAVALVDDGDDSGGGGGSGVNERDDHHDDHINSSADDGSRTGNAPARVDNAVAAAVTGASPRRRGRPPKQRQSQTPPPPPPSHEHDEQQSPLAATACLSTSLAPRKRAATRSRATTTTALTRAAAAAAAAAVKQAACTPVKRRGRKPKATLLLQLQQQQQPPPPSSTTAALAATAAQASSRGRRRRAGKMSDEDTAAALSRAVAARLASDTHTSTATTVNNNNKATAADAPAHKDNVMQEFTL